MLLFILSSFAFSSITFQPMREDLKMPANCVFLTSEDFSENHDRVIYGIEGAKKKGFTHEFPIQRQEARDLWQALNDDSQSIAVVRDSQKLSDLKKILDTDGRDMGFDFKKEGDVLEAFALLDLKKQYPDDEYFRTGGYEYHNERGPTVGELDILVGRRSDCNIIVIGEAKLGYKMIHKAHEQLSRFERFYRQEAP
ncbi:MAG: hypothetical protein KDD37_05940 [Bdellovibrionales bacterium]|nr:hypothetical protein [Bdellovibrionales bacterium]